MIIGFLGAKNTGKSTSANYLRDEFGFTKLSFADPIKDICAILFNWPRDMLEGDSIESRVWREQTDKKWEKFLNYKGFSPRIAMSAVGTDIIRKHFNQNIWVYSLINRITDDKNFVIADCRHTNETQALIKHGGIVIRIEQQLPEWIDIAMNANTGDKNAEYEMQRLGIHENEYQWLSAPYTHLLKNDSDVDTLKSRIYEIYKELS
jgi:hypothetical protein